MEAAVSLRSQEGGQDNGNVFNIYVHVLLLITPCAVWNTLSVSLLPEAPSSLVMTVCGPYRALTRLPQLCLVISVKGRNLTLWKERVNIVNFPRKWRVSLKQ